MSMYSKGGDRPPKTNKLRLYGTRFDPYTTGLRLYLIAKGVDYEFALLDMINKPEWYVEISPIQRIPAVENGDESVGESLVIYDYVENKFPQKPLRPSDPYARAKDTEFMTRFAEHLTPHIFGSVRAPKDHAEALQASLLKVSKVLAHRGTDYFGGESPNLLDWYAFGWVNLLPALEKVHNLDFAYLSKKDYEHYKDWTSRMDKHPIVDAERKSVKVNLGVQVQFIQTVIEGKANHLIGY